MTDPKKKSSSAPIPDSEDEDDVNATDEISQYIRKIQLQSQVLKKLSKNLEQSVGKETDSQKGKTDDKKK
jgi:hypothetical protein